MVNVLIIMFQDLVDTVTVYQDSEPAKVAFEKETSVNYDNFIERCSSEDTETILGDFAGSNIYETEVK